MVENISVAKKLTASAGASGFASLYTVPAAAKLKITHVRVHFPNTVDVNLEIALVVGIKYIYPTEGKMNGDGTTWEFRSIQELDSGSEIKVEYKNLDGASPHTCYILLEGIVER